MGPPLAPVNTPGEDFLGEGATPSLRTAHHWAACTSARLPRMSPASQPDATATAHPPPNSGRPSGRRAARRASRRTLSARVCESSRARARASTGPTASRPPAGRPRTRSHRPPRRREGSATSRRQHPPPQPTRATRWRSRAHSAVGGGPRQERPSQRRLGASFVQLVNPPPALQPQPDRHVRYHVRRVLTLTTLSPRVPGGSCPQPYCHMLPYRFHAKRKRSLGRQS